MTQAANDLAFGEQAAAVLTPLRLRLLKGLKKPASAASLARHVGLPRQKVNYHLKALERAELIDAVEERRKGNCIEVLMQARAESLVVATSVLGDVGVEPGKIQDRFSWGYLVAVCAQTVRDMASLRRGADNENKTLATLTLEADITFRSAEERSAFADELATTFAQLAKKYHAPDAQDGRTFHTFAAAYAAAAPSKDTES